MPDAVVPDVPVELCLEPVAIVSTNFTNAKRELFNNTGNEVHRIRLSVFFVDPIVFRLYLESLVGGLSLWSNAKSDIFCLNEKSKRCKNANSDCIINRSVLETTYELTAFPFECQGLNVDLDMVTPLSRFGGKPLPGNGKPATDSGWYEPPASARLRGAG